MHGVRNLAPLGAYSPPDHVPGPQGAQHIHNQVMPCRQQAQAWLLSDAEKWKGGLPSGTNLQGLDRLLLHLLHAAVGALRQQRGERRLGARASKVQAVRLCTHAYGARAAGRARQASPAGMPSSHGIAPSPISWLCTPPLQGHAARLLAHVLCLDYRLGI